SYTNYGIPDIKDTNADIIYKSERSTGTGNGGFSYTIPVTNGDYKVKIHFAEIYWGATGGGPGKQGKRLINMSLENKVVLSNLDLVKEVGSETALIKIYSTSVKDGLLNIDMSASVDEPKVSAIEITKIITEEDEVVTRINAGSGAVNIDGKVYESDMNFTGSTSAYTNPDIKDIKNTTQDELYKSERSASVDFGKFGYAIPVEDGDYRVELHFAEIYWGAPGGGNGDVGKRKFSVAVENKKVLENYDMIADLGLMTATVKKYQTTVSDGTLNIDFTASKDRPKIAAIEVFKENEATEEELPLIASFNSGGQDITLDGTLFKEDAYFRGNSKANTTTLTEIADTDIDALYLTERSTQSDKQSFSYDFPVTNGTYQVKLHFAEIYFGAPQSGPGGAGRRLIEVEMEDESRIEDLDIIKEVGTGTALIKTFEVQVSDGELNINLGASVNRPQLCGIQLYGNGELGEEGQDPCTWTELATSELEKLESQAAKIGNKLYTFSGFLNGFIITPETEIYDFENDVWSMGAPMPTPATHVGRAVVNDEVWLIGGFTGNNPGIATDEVYIYNATTDTWRLGPALPAPRGSGAATFADGKVHFFGGLLPDRVTDTNEHYTIDPENPSEGWVAAAPLPMGRNHLSAITLDGLVYAIGGQYGHDREIDYLSFVHAYNPATDTWERKADLPSDRSHFEPCTVSHNGKIIIIGGRRGFFFFDEMTEYDPELNSWSQICKLPEPLLAPAAAIFNDTLVIANGGNGETDLRDNTRFLILESENTLGTSEDESSLSNSSNLDDSVKLFPNPTQGEITISGIRANSQTVVINIKNITGANLITQKFDMSASSYTMDTANLKTGIYFMEIITDSNSRKVIKFIKK
ncbi:MAG: malectin domain-containing carbohydrate-binding protein, partial [Leeuwenhoekiella sp.]